MSDNAPATIDGRYELIDEIGAGGTASVWKARNILGGFICAVKLMEISRTCYDLCRDEFRLLSALWHPNIIRTYEMGYLDDCGQCYLSMEYMGGKTWKDQVDVTRDKALSWLEQIVGVLQYLHDPRTGVIHKDIKPANIVVAGDRAVLIDFNIATRQAAHLGTPAYKCPLVEQEGQGWKAYADVWALAVSFYELVTKHELFNDKSSPSFTVKLHPKPKVDIPKRIYDAICSIVIGGGQDTLPSDYKALFGINTTVVKPIDLPPGILKQFKVSSKLQQFLIKAMLSQENIGKPKSKNVIAREALHAVGLPTSSAEISRLRNVMSQLKGLGVLEYAGKGRAKIILKREFVIALEDKA